MEILVPTIKKLHDEAILKKEKKLASLTKLALEDMEQVQKRRIGGVSLPPPPSEVGEDAIESESIRVEDIVSIENIGDRYYKCYKLACQNWMPIKIQQSSLEVIQKLTAHGLLSGEENWEYPKKEGSKEMRIDLALALKNGLNPFDSKFHCEEENGLTAFELLWPNETIESKENKENKNKINSQYQYKLIDDLINTICHCYIGSKTEEAIQVLVAQTLLTIFVNSAIKIHGVTLIKMVQTLINMTVYSTKPVIQTTSKAILTQMVNLVVSRMEECNQKIKNQNGKLEIKKEEKEEANENNNTSLPEIPVENESINTKSRNSKLADKNYSVIENLILEKEMLEEDGILVLHLLCHLSLGFDATILNDQESAILADSRCRMISLELILSMLNNSGRLFQTDLRFSQVLKRNLCVSLSKNGISTDPTTFELSLSIFIVLFSSFRATLKSEIEVLFKEIYLRLINMQSSTYYQKSLILQALMKICRNPQAIVDMYVNYDCNIGSSSIFENMMDLLSKVAQGRQTKNIPNQNNKKGRIFNDSNSTNDISEDRWLKVRGLRCLVTVLNSLVEWSKGNNNNNNNKTIDSRENTPIQSISEVDGLPVVVNKNHLEHVGNYDLSNAKSNKYSESNGNSDDDDPLKIQQISSQKQLWVHGINTFNQSPKKGLIELQMNGFVTEDPKDIAKFFLETNELSKQSIGTYLGRPEEKAIQIMHAFVDQFDFFKMSFVDALRAFVQSFRLPKETQQIDRILEKFADRYCETNPKEFESADTAYVLAFSVMMLNTDQHSQQVKNRMDQMMFIRNNKGINNGKDLEESYLINIFEDIKNKEIIMEEEHFNKDLSGPTEKLIRYHQETAFLQKKLVSLFQGQDSSKQSNLFLSATHSDHVKPMFAIAWYPVIAALSRIFEEINDINNDNLSEREINEESIELCLEGFSGAIRISCLYYMEIERNAFISALVKFTSINKIDSMRPKSIQCIKTLTNLAYIYGEYLDESWELILEAISRMEQLHLFGDQSESPSRISSRDKTTSTHTRRSLSIDGKVTTSTRRLTGGPLALSQDLSLIEQLRSQLNFSEKLNELRSQSFLVAIDKIFGNSSNFNGLSIIHFYRAICNVSLQEVDEGYPGRPRTFSLHKIVEITYYNMTRIRLEWTQIWKILRPYFNTVGCHEDHHVAALAIDSLRQLSMKFFERSELSQFHTQHDFLKPFEHISRHNLSPNMQDLILQSLSQMVTAKASNIKSGWKSVFSVLGNLAANNPSLSVLAASFQLVKLVFEQHFSILGIGFVDGVNCLVSFGINKVSKDIALEAIELIQQCVEPFLKVQEENSNSNETNNNNETISQDDLLFLRWFPVLSSLSRIVIDAHFDSLREESLIRLFETLKLSGKLYSPNFWNSILRSVLLPIFDDVKLKVKNKSKESETWVKALTLLISLFEEYYHDLANNMEFLEQMFHLIASTLSFHLDDNLTKHGLAIFKAIVIDNSARFELELWNLITKCLNEFFEITTPHYLFEILPEGFDENTQESMEDKQTDDKNEIINQNHLSNNDIPFENEYEKDEINDEKDEINNEKDEINNEKQAIIQENIKFINGKNKIINHDNNYDKPEIDLQSELLKCRVHLSVLHMIREIAQYSDKEEEIHNNKNKNYSNPMMNMPPTISRQWLKLLKGSAEFAARFNEHKQLRHYLWSNNHVAQLPHLIRQETSALSIYLQIAYSLYTKFGDSYDTLLNESNNTEFKFQVKPMFPELIQESERILMLFIELIKEHSNKQRDIANWSYLVAQIFKDVGNVPWNKKGEKEEVPNDEQVQVEYNLFLPHLKSLYYLAVDVSLTDKMEVRLAVNQFLKKVGNVLF
ncbi:Sec7-domain-containing protein [Neoconidiobolus thromboides FSU 785]|nr:Sec7-domain-containing protein [Neoconidiobolus thromboides FSU 785]